jgi:type IV pilus assembly protein PilM
MFRLGPPKYSLGIDIGSSSLKFIQLRKTKQGITIVGHGIERYPPGVFQDGTLQDPSAVVQTIKNLKKEHNLKTDQVFGCITSQNTILRFLSLPDMGDEELKHAIDGEAEQYVPYPLETVNIHFSKLARVEQEGMGRILSLLAVAQKEHVESLMSIFRSVGMKNIDALDVDALCLINALDEYLSRGASFEEAAESEGGDDEAAAEPKVETMNEDEVTAILCIGARSTIINVLKGNILRFSRNIKESGNSITDVIRSIYKVSMEEAEEIKLEKSHQAMEGDEDQEFADVVQTTVEEIAGEIRRSFDYYKAQHREQQIHRVVLTGGTAKLKDINVLLHNELGVDVEIADPSYGLLRDMDAEELFEENLQEYTVAIGLALRGWDEEEQK